MEQKLGLPTLTFNNCQLYTLLQTIWTFQNGRGIPIISIFGACFENCLTKILKCTVQFYSQFMSRWTVFVIGLDMLLFETEHEYSECRSSLDKLVTVNTFLTVELDNSIKSESTIVPFLFQTTLGLGSPELIINVSSF